MFGGMNVNRFKNASGTLVILNVLLYIAMVIFSPRGLGNFVYCKTLIPVSVAKYLLFGAQVGVIVSGCGEWFRLFTAMFVHGGILHLLFNMYALYYLGNLVEYTYGVWRFLVFYFASGFVGNVATQIFYKSSISLGASGAIFGLAGVLLSAGFRSDTPIFLRPYTGAALLPMVIFNIVYGFIPGSGINNAAHIGGLITGMIFGYFTGVPHYSISLRELSYRIRYRDFWTNPWYRNLRREFVWVLAGSASIVIVMIAFIALIPSSVRMISALRGW